MTPEQEAYLAKSEAVQHLILPMLDDMIEECSLEIDDLLIREASPAQFAMVCGKRKAVNDVIYWLESLMNRPEKSESGAEKSGN